MEGWGCAERAMRLMVQRYENDLEDVPLKWECKLICETDEDFSKTLAELDFDDRAIDLERFWL